MAGLGRSGAADVPAAPIWNAGPRFADPDTDWWWTGAAYVVPWVVALAIVHPKHRWVDVSVLFWLIVGLGRSAYRHYFAEDDGPKTEPESESVPAARLPWQLRGAITVAAGVAVAAAAHTTFLQFVGVGLIAEGAWELSLNGAAVVLHRRRERRLAQPDPFALR